jgi:hypothetical protein
MFTKYAFVVLGVVIVLCSCGGREKEEEMMAKMLNETLVKAAKNVSSNNYQIYNDFNNKLENPASSEKAHYFKNKMDSIKLQSKNIYNYVDSVKSLKNIDWLSLNKYIDNSKKKFLSIDEDLSKEFLEEINKFNGNLDSLINTKNDLFLREVSDNKKNVFLSKLFCDVKLLENELARFVNSKISNNAFTFDSYSILIGQNVKHLKIGEELIISAGVGAFSSKAQSQITIAQKTIPAINGQATYKLKVIGKLGKHIIPVKIEFKDEYDNKKVQILEIEYTIHK